MLKEQQNVPHGEGLARAGPVHQTQTQSAIFKGWSKSKNGMVCFHFENHFKKQFPGILLQQEGTEC